MQVLVSVINQSEHYPQLGKCVSSLVVDVDSGASVQSIINALSQKLSVPSKSLRIILCGKILFNDVKIEDLFLGPQTSLAALVIDDAKNQKLTVRDSAKYVGITQDTKFSFQIYCKRCDSLKQGKLRVYCPQCNSSSLLTKRDPTEWKDVLSSSVILADCQNCKKEVYVRFCFKCIQCNEVSIPLIHCRGRGVECECCICGEVLSQVIVDFGCHHLMCLHCFIAYMTTSFEQQRFVLRPPYGYTLSCPIYDCNGCVTDPHHFYLLGKVNYELYKTMAAEKFVTVERGGIFCPNPKCGAAFIWERKSDRQQMISNFVRCPECLHTFCEACRSENCSCRENDATRATIQITCKNCPSCSAPTERNGGCTHMHCTNCNAHWCFLCVKTWSEECQWNHWFD